MWILIRFATVAGMDSMILGVPVFIQNYTDLRNSQKGNTYTSRHHPNIMQGRTSRQQTNKERKHLVAQVIHNVFYADAWNPSVDLESVGTMDANLLIGNKAAILHRYASGKTVLGITKTGCKIHDQNATLYNQACTDIISQFNRRSGSGKVEPRWIKAW